ncbi:unnamed protein product, partial [Notodromas monacha]
MTEFESRDDSQLELESRPEARQLLYYYQLKPSNQTRVELVEGPVWADVVPARILRRAELIRLFEDFVGLGFQVHLDTDGFPVVHRGKEAFKFVRGRRPTSTSIRSKDPHKLIDRFRNNLAIDRKSAAQKLKIKPCGMRIPGINSQVLPARISGSFRRSPGGESLEKLIVEEDQVLGVNASCSTHELDSPIDEIQMIKNYKRKKDSSGREFVETTRQLKTVKSRQSSFRRKEKPDRFQSSLNFARCYFVRSSGLNIRLKEIADHGLKFPDTSTSSKTQPCRNPTDPNNTDPSQSSRVIAGQDENNPDVDKTHSDSSAKDSKASHPRSEMPIEIICNLSLLFKYEKKYLKQLNDCLAKMNIPPIQPDAVDQFLRTLTETHQETETSFAEKVPSKTQNEVASAQVSTTNQENTPQNEIPQMMKNLHDEEKNMFGPPRADSLSRAGSNQPILVEPRISTNNLRNKQNVCQKKSDFGRKFVFGPGEEEESLVKDFEPLTPNFGRVSRRPSAAVNPKINDDDPETGEIHLPNAMKQSQVKQLLADFHQEGETGSGEEIGMTYYSPAPKHVKPIHSNHNQQKDLANILKHKENLRAFMMDKSQPSGTMECITRDFLQSHSDISSPTSFPSSLSQSQHSGIDNNNNEEDGLRLTFKSSSTKKEAGRKS